MYLFPVSLHRVPHGCWVKQYTASVTPQQAHLEWNEVNFTVSLTEILLGWKSQLNARKCKCMPDSHASLLPTTILSPDRSHRALSVWLALAPITLGHMGD